jgi:hypothetical protein
MKQLDKNRRRTSLQTNTPNEMAAITAKFDRGKFLSLHLCTSDNLSAHIKGAAYWVEFGNKNQSVYHV